AQAQLEDGEVLGPALQRGYQVAVPAPRVASARMAAPAAAAPMLGAGPGSAAQQAVVESGKVAVDATINFLFSVLGAPARLATQTIVNGAPKAQQEVHP